MARKVLLEKLDETGMRKVYDEIDASSCLYPGFHGKMGIFVRMEELSSYGEKLKVRIQELEKTIWQEAGEEFNINSPKQLGVILFEKMAIPKYNELYSLFLFAIQDGAPHSSKDVKQSSLKNSN